MNLKCFVIITALCITTSRGNSEGYEYFPKIDMLYKFHSVPQNWTESTKICHQEGATLAMPLNTDELSSLLTIFNRYPAKSISGTFYTDVLLLGFHDIFNEGEYITLSGLPIQYFYHTWDHGQPDNHNDHEDCGNLFRVGTLNDLNCGIAAVFICQKKIYFGDTTSDEKLPNDRAYIHAPHLRSAYKIHLNIKKWAEARTICQSEGGHLAIINNVAEKDFLVKMFNEPESKIIYANQSDYALLGFHDLFQEGYFITVEGDTLDSTGFTQWACNEPSGNGDCGSMHIDGLLNDFPCDIPAVFFCEKTVSITYLHDVKKRCEI